MSPALRLLSSRAPERLLDAATDHLHREHGLTVRTASAGGVEVARRMRRGEPVDLVVLAEDALRGLSTEGSVHPATVTALFTSDAVLAVRSSAQPPPLRTLAQLRDVLRSADGVAYSTGPSGTALVARLEEWGLAGTLRLVQAPPGVPVGRLLAQGVAEVGVQQRSELTGIEGVRVVGPLPGPAALTTTFAGAVAAGSAHPALAERVLALLAGDELSHLVRAHGMLPARPG
ncbi:substrate-binding domain-containing protein [Phycicoccus endophyticus]|uniref:Substrate-binding domain-containing protein n=1 Tax=Phycicoccus endophyticus TaxID=1690220 RepID=A0A7G9R220_9MICO|nr:substrate-binding domain-containing protein [Phycicoccus endophyticus]NHI19715.1 ABC transporter substrate-binding protein [Phycicoccus endophyticus]QNN49645.1 substrate-binding domain-containing protein [Phycicoccus endophyticus]GGL33622.1 hypothetical protein GCM10012283_15130 [Phycicoccus endophyticus]